MKLLLEEKFEKLYLRFRANYYRRMVERIGPREGSLSATESYCVEIIYLLGKPTLSEFARFLGISVPNANYKVNGLVKKGYVKKRLSPTDKREHLLIVTEKFLQYYGLKDADIADMIEKLQQRLPPDELTAMEQMIDTLLDVMPNPMETAHD